MAERDNSDPSTPGSTTTGPPVGAMRRDDETAIRRLVRALQDGQNARDGELFASAFAREHDYVAINGMFMPDQTREDNARVHQRLFADGASSVAGKYGEVVVRLAVRKIRPVAPGVAVVHILGEFRTKDGSGKKAANVVSAVARREEGRWEIVAFHNAPVQRRKGEDAGFAIRVEGMDTQRGGKEIIKDVPLIGVFVNDQEAALDFYANKLGMEKVQDEAYGPEARWITVSPAETGIRIVLKKAEKDYEKAVVGNSDGAPVLTLGTDDVHSAYERLTERGVRFIGEPYRYPSGVGALLLDQDGSPVLLHQERAEAADAPGEENSG